MIGGLVCVRPACYQERLPSRGVGFGDWQRRAVPGAAYRSCCGWSPALQVQLALQLGRRADCHSQFLPVFVSRGVVQLSALYRQFSPATSARRSRRAAAFTDALYLLPVSLFGMSVSASEFPEMSSAVGSDSADCGISL